MCQPCVSHVGQPWVSSKGSSRLISIRERVTHHKSSRLTRVIMTHQEQSLVIMTHRESSITSPILFRLHIILHPGGISTSHHCRHRHEGRTELPTTTYHHLTTTTTTIHHGLPPHHHEYAGTEQNSICCTTCEKQRRGSSEKRGAASLENKKYHPS